MNFPCKKCGRCCSRYHVEIRSSIEVIVPGRCPNLNEKNLCIIYRDRPTLCRIPENEYGLQMFGCEMLKEKI